MKTMMFVIAMFIPACAWFNKDVKPVVTCSGQIISAANITRAENDLMPPVNYVDLAEECVTLGWDVGACLIDYVKTTKPETVKAADQFKRQHATEIRAAGPVTMSSSASLTCG